MKHLFVCGSGIWNSVVDKRYGMPVLTNVVKFFNAIKEGDAHQHVDGPSVKRLHQADHRAKAVAPAASQEHV